MASWSTWVEGSGCRNGENCCGSAALAILSTFTGHSYSPGQVDILPDVKIELERQRGCFRFSKFNIDAFIAFIVFGIADMPRFRQRRVTLGLYKGSEGTIYSVIELDYKHVQVRSCRM